MKRKNQHRLTTMRKSRPRSRFYRDESGGVAVMTAILLIVLVGFLALVIDVGNLMAVRNEVQNAADAGALAGARALFPFNGYPDGGLIPVTEPPFVSVAVSTARAAVSNNQAGGVVNLTTLGGDVETGTWDFDARTFVPDSNPSYSINAVRVKVRRDSLANQPVTTWLAFLLGYDTMPVNAVSIAAVGFLKKTYGAYLPIWIPEHIYRTWMEMDDMNIIQASADGTDNFAWAAPSPQSASAGYLKEAVAGDGTVASPEMDGGVNLSNGVDASVNQEILKQISAGRSELPAEYYYHDTGSIGPDGNPIYTVNHDAIGSIDANGEIDGNAISYPNDPDTYGSKAGQPVTGWLTFLLVGERTDADGNELPYDDNDPGKMNQNANVTYFMPVIVTDIVNEKGQKKIEFYKLRGETQVVAPGGEPGTKPNQIYATSPVIVR